MPREDIFLNASCSKILEEGGGGEAHEIAGKALQEKIMIVFFKVWWELLPLW